ncbi:hypothetical protein HKX48_007398 [Thoreauomyces humboldtii]|nr:hypothetical protein HKX48_007398 [Thoreauomyces humboldtii]
MIGADKQQQPGALLLVIEERYRRAHVRKEVPRFHKTCTTVFDMIDLQALGDTLSNSKQPNSGVPASTLVLQPCEPFYGVERKGESICTYLPNTVQRGHQTKLLEELNLLLANGRANPKKRKRDARHPDYKERSDALQFHLGVWQALCGKVAVVMDESRKTNDVLRAVQRIVQSDAFNELSLLTSFLLDAFDPVKAFEYRTAFEAMAPECTGFWARCPTNTTFPSLVIVANDQVHPHRDLKDVKDGWCAITCLGSFEGGASCLPDLGIKFPFQPGDVLMIRSFALEHFVEQWQGKEWFTMVQFMHQLVFNGVLAPGRQTTHLTGSKVTVSEAAPSTPTKPSRVQISPVKKPDPFAAETHDSFIVDEFMDKHVIPFLKIELFFKIYSIPLDRQFKFIKRGYAHFNKDKPEKEILKLSKKAEEVCLKYIKEKITSIHTNLVKTVRVAVGGQFSGKDFLKELHATVRKGDVLSTDSDPWGTTVFCFEALCAMWVSHLQLFIGQVQASLNLFRKSKTDFGNIKQSEILVLYAVFKSTVTKVPRGQQILRVRKCDYAIESFLDKKGRKKSPKVIETVLVESDPEYVQSATPESDAESSAFSEAGKEESDNKEVWSDHIEEESDDEGGEQADKAGEGDVATEEKRSALIGLLEDSGINKPEALVDDADWMKGPEELLSAKSSPKKPCVIKFFDKDERYYSFTNFARGYEINDADHGTFKLAEHMYQAMKFCGNPLVFGFVRAADGPRDAFNMVHYYQQYVLTDWEDHCLEEMFRVVRLKFKQHARLRKLLDNTAPPELVEANPEDYFWGEGADGSGENMLGRILMAIRDHPTRKRFGDGFS